MKIGKIISVEYDKFRVRLFHTTRNSTVNIDGKVYYFGNQKKSGKSFTIEVENSVKLCLEIIAIPSIIFR